MKEVNIYASGSMEERVIYSTTVFSSDNKNRRSNISNSLDKHFPFDDLNSTGKQCPSVGAFTIYCVFEIRFQEVSMISCNYSQSPSSYIEAPLCTV